MSQGSDLACVVHAFGRGILATRSGLQGHLGWLQKQFALDSSDSVLHHAPPGQGAACWEILWPLLCGGRLVLAHAAARNDLASPLDCRAQGQRPPS